ncbi:TRAP transporter small permease [Aquamicrobium zhengzhouense]|uniref:TRAP transporter small permease protein n=1 Tax=Aquamicrobium zhengzhouense TaxID=2781738 RepID=A0ABS0SGH3_9HYPH|nr:TRAP transporter small permease [Aquamicrobium zhengzhouense]MBI1621685.1 TRAP transporter small permease [Aquamicrobium zhengzhouense]
MRYLALLTRIIDGTSRTALGLIFLALIAVVSLQIFTRTFGLYSPVWTEELSRYLLLYMTAFGIGLSFVTGELVNVDMLQEAVPARVAWWMRLFAAVATAGMCIAMIYPSWLFTSIGAFQRSPSLRWTMDYLHASMLILSVLLLIFAVARVVGMLVGIDDGHPQRPEEI